MNILGYHGSFHHVEDERRIGHGGHDAAAVLIRDGQVVAAFEEERLNRLKHANCFPVRAIRECLRIGGLSSIDQVDHICLNVSRPMMDRQARAAWLGKPSTDAARDGRSRVAACFSNALGQDVAAKLSFCPHHLAHAWSALVPSGFDESLVFIADGDGEDLSGMVLTGRGRELTPLRSYAASKSLGQLYTGIISFIGYGRFEEYKAMGLAPYGDPTVYAPLFEEGCRLLPDGDYDIDPVDEWVSRLERAGVLALARKRGQPFTQVHMDLAAALQKATERIMLHVLTHYRRQTGQRHLCMAGGVAHNCSANGAVLYSTLFDEVFVQPAAHDAGGAYGAAVHAAVEHGVDLRRPRWTHVYLGTETHRGDGVLPVLERWRSLVSWEYIGDRPDVPAKLLAGGAVIGWMQGRAEFGPRALGNRSILADPRPPENKARINAMVKKREGYRPFAPSVLAERVRDYFEVPGEQDEFPFMIFVLKVKPEVRELLGAITHVDGTARVQTVAREANPRFWSLIHAFERETGVGMLLNTSLNNNAEPIVDTADDAIACFLTTGLDYLVVDDYLIRKPAEIPAACYGRLVPALPAHRRLVRAQWPEHGAADRESFTVESTRSEFFGPMNTSISKDMYRVLGRADTRRTLADLFDGSNAVSGAGAEPLYREAARLWADRVIALRPV
jgi:carbamoyltransferase